jgi:hypothetical protein
LSLSGIGSIRWDAADQAFNPDSSEGEKAFSRRIKKGA